MVIILDLEIGMGTQKYQRKMSLQDICQYFLCDFINISTYMASSTYLLQHLWFASFFEYKSMNTWIRSTKIPIFL